MTRFRSVVCFCVGAAIWSCPAAAHDPITIDDPAEVHRLLAAGKAGRLQAAREATVGSVSSPEQWNYDVQYYDINLRLIIPLKALAGRVLMKSISLKDSLTQFDVDLHYALSADSVFVDGAAAAFSHIGSEVFITPASPYDSGAGFDAVIYYHGTPKSGGFLTGGIGFAEHGSPPVPMVWTLSEPYWAREWWPCKDTPSDKADSVDIHITCPDNLFASSNGLLAGETDNGDGTATYHWRHRYPITTYLVSFAVTNFVRLDDWYRYNGGSDSMPVYYWVYPEHVAQAQAQYAEIPELIEALSYYFGPYPFLKEKYAVTQFEPAGMEHQTNTSQSHTWYSWYLDEHELAHQWWGDMVTCASWHHIWLNEGIGTWTEALVKEYQEGPAAYLPYMLGIRYTGGGTIYVDDTTNAFRIFSGDLSYHKGAWVMHMLRGILGDEALFGGMMEYRQRYLYQSATTEDFRNVLEDHTGRDLHQFFLDWIYGERFPNYQYALLTVPEGDRYHTMVKISQVQSTMPTVFDMPIEVVLRNASHDTTVTLNNTRRAEVFDLYLPFEPTALDFDPNQWILRDVSQSEFGVAILNDTLEPAYRNFAYADTLQAMNGTPPYYWFAVNPADLPYNIAVNVDGTITGIPYQAEGAYTFEVRVYSSGAEPSTRRYVTLVIHPPLYAQGDVTCDHEIRSNDIIFLVNHVYRGGPAPEPAILGDVNMTCDIDMADIIYLVNFIYKAGPEPMAGCM